VLVQTFNDLSEPDEIGTQIFEPVPMTIWTIQIRTGSKSRYGVGLCTGRLVILV